MENVVPKKVATDEKIKELLDGIRGESKVMMGKVVVPTATICSDRLVRIIKGGDMGPVNYLTAMVKDPAEKPVTSARAADILGKCAASLDETRRERALRAVAETFSGRGTIDYCVPYTFPATLASLAGENLEKLKSAFKILEGASRKVEAPREDLRGKGRVVIENLIEKEKDKRSEKLTESLALLNGKINLLSKQAVKG